MSAYMHIHMHSRRTVMHKSWEREQKWRGTAKSFFERNMELTNLNNALKRELAVMSRKYSHTSEMLNSIRKKANINRAAMTVCIVCACMRVCTCIYLYRVLLFYILMNCPH